MSTNIDDKQPPNKRRRCTTPTVEEKRESFLKALKLDDPELILFKELTSNVDQNQREIDGSYEFVMSLGEAKMMSKFEVFRSEAVTLTDADISLQYRGKGDVITHTEIPALVELVKLTRKVDNCIIYVACWHGKNNNITEEQGQLDQLEAFLWIVGKKCGNYPTVIGGDFNLPSEYAWNCVAHMTNFIPHYMKYPSDDEIDGVDYVYTKEFTRVEYMDGYNCDEDVRKLLDHKPIVLEVETEIGEEQKRISRFV